MLIRSQASRHLPTPVMRVPGRGKSKCPTGPAGSGGDRTQTQVGWLRNWSHATLFRGRDLTVKVCPAPLFTLSAGQCYFRVGLRILTTAEPIGSLLCAQYLLKSQVLLTGTHADPVVGIVPVFQRRNRRLGRLVSAPKGTMTLGCRAGLPSLHAGSTCCPPSPPGLGAGELGTSLPSSPEAGLLVVSSNWSGSSHFYLKYLLVWLTFMSLKTFHQLHFF